MARLTKEQKILQRQRAQFEFELRLLEFTDKFKSKEEPTIKLTKTEKVESLSKIVYKSISFL